MKKVLLRGHNIGEFDDQEKIATVYKEDEIKAYLEQKTPEAREIFIHAHGGQHFPEENLTLTPNLMLTLSNNTEEFAHNILSKIVQNTEENKPNIVHIMSCYSGTAQHNLKDINGNIVVCTYAPADHSTNIRVNNTFFGIKNNFDNLKEFIVKSLPLLTAVGFSISYKLDEAIYSLNFDNSNIKKMDLNSFSEFLQEQYIKVQEFYIDLQGKFANEYLELFPDYNFPEKIFYSTNKLKQAFSLLLNLDSDKLSVEEIGHILEIDNSCIDAVMHRSMESMRKDVIEKIINKLESVEYASISENSNIYISLGLAIKFNDLATFYSVLNKAEKFSEYILYDTLKNEKKEMLEALINSNKITITTPLFLIEAVRNNNLPLAKLLYSKAEISLEYFVRNIVSDLNNFEIMEWLIDIDTDNTINYLVYNEFLSKAIEQYSTLNKLYGFMRESLEENLLSLFTKILDKKDVILDSTIYLAVEKGNSKWTKMILDKMAETSSFTKAINSNDFIKVENMMKNGHNNITNIAAIIMSDNFDMVKILINEVGEDKVIDVALKLGHSLTIQNILNEKENNGNLDSDELNKIFETAIKVSKGNVIEDIMDKMPEVTSQHLKLAIELHTPDRLFIFEKISNRIEKIDGNLIEVAVNSNSYEILQNVLNKVVDDQKDTLVQYNLYKALDSGNYINFNWFLEILVNEIKQVQDKFKHDLLDLSAKTNNFHIFKKLLDKLGLLDDEHINNYLNLIDPLNNFYKADIFKKLTAMKDVAQNHTITELDVVTDNVTIIGENDLTAIAD